MWIQLQFVRQQLTSFTQPGSSLLGMFNFLSQFHYSKCPDSSSNSVQLAQKNFDFSKSLPISVLQCLALLIEKFPQQLRICINSCPSLEFFLLHKNQTKRTLSLQSEKYYPVLTSFFLSYHNLLAFSSTLAHFLSLLIYSLDHFSSLYIQQVFHYTFNKSYQNRNFCFCASFVTSFKLLPNIFISPNITMLIQFSLKEPHFTESETLIHISQIHLSTSTSYRNETNQVIL